ncbi:MAG: hypothetical protein H0W59_08725 [Chloroflexia bacterium]|nr:hypothetical protein [Chloroflexia bacterium]
MDNQFGFINPASERAPTRVPLFRLRRVPTRIPLFRLRRMVGPTVVEHFYTSSVEEHREAMYHHGYELEGVIGLIYSGAAPGTDPLVRLWHQPSRRHSLTAHPENLAAAVATGTYQHEGVAGYVFNTPNRPGTIPLYALVSRATNAHLYTTEPAERDAALAAGYEALGIACWVYPVQLEGNGE